MKLLFHYLFLLQYRESAQTDTLESKVQPEVVTREVRDFIWQILIIYLETNSDISYVYYDVGCLGKLFSSQLYFC